MTILVAYLSKHGSTKGIAERITAKLQQLGMDTDLRPIDAVEALAAYDAFVIGSAVYYGAWLKDAVEFVRHNQAALVERPVWLFSSGPLGHEAKDAEEEPKQIAELQQAIHPRDHRVFFGALDHTKLSFFERTVVKTVHAPEGDYRDWGAVEAWAESIAHALTPVERRI
jgi:menaquinone-dependent protoporphyrinogen oxidase